MLENAKQCERIKIGLCHFNESECISSDKHTMRSLYQGFPFHLSTSTLDIAVVYCP